MIRSKLPVGTYINRLIQDTNIVAKLVVGSHENDEAHEYKTSVVTLASTMTVKQTNKHIHIATCTGMLFTLN